MHSSEATKIEFAVSWLSAWFNGSLIKLLFFLMGPTKREVTEAKRFRIRGGAGGGGGGGGIEDFTFGTGTSERGRILVS